MATLARAPTLSGRQQPRQLTPSRTHANLLTTTLAVVAATLPFQTSSSFPQQQAAPSKRHSLNADTSRGMPKGLYADAVSPQFNVPHLTAQHPGSANPDASAASPLALLSVPVGDPPFRPLLALSPSRRKLLHADTSAGTPKPLYEDTVVAVFDGPHYGPHRHWRLNPDTAAGAPLALLTVVQPPLFNPPTLAVDPVRVNPDTSRGTPKTLYGDAVMPVFNTAPLLAHRKPAVVDTSAGTPKGLYPDADTPTFNAPHTAPDRVRPASDTSFGMALSLATFVPPEMPFFTPPHVGPAWRAWVADTAAGIPHTLLPTVGVEPFVPAPHIAPAWRNWQPASATATVLPLVVADVTAVVMSAPPKRRRAQVRSRPANIQTRSR